MEYANFALIRFNEVEERAATPTSAKVETKEEIKAEVKSEPDDDSPKSAASLHPSMIPLARQIWTGYPHAVKIASPLDLSVNF